MAFYKGDSYYEAHVDDGPEYHSDESAESNEWVNDNYEILQEFYSEFKRLGSITFSRTFFQFGNFSDFCDFVFKKTII